MSSTIRHGHNPQFHEAVCASSPAFPLNPTDADHTPPTATASPLRVSPLEINEILYSVFLLLDQETLKTAVYFVCRRWRFISIRYIIRTLHMHHDNKKLLADLPRRLLHFTALEVGQKIKNSACACLSLEETIRSSEMLDQLVEALEQIQSEFENGDRRSNAIDHLHLQDLENNPRRLQIQMLTLNLQVPRKLDPLLSLFVPSNLRELTIDFDLKTNAVHLGTILDLCSNLLRLKLSSSKVLPRAGPAFAKSKAELHPDADHESHRPHPLQSLHIADMHVVPRNLWSYFRRLERLTELHCLERMRYRSNGAVNTYEDDRSRVIFWETLARHCPLLESLHFSVNVYSSLITIVKLFPRLHDYRVNGSSDFSSLLRDILNNGVEDKITTLKAIKAIEGEVDIPFGNEYFEHEGYRELCDFLHRFLCSAPQLVHLTIGPFSLSSSVLWGEGDQTGMWTCRRLKTLSLILRKNLLQYRGSKAEARHVFAYISRFCPELEELEIEANCPGLSLKSGLCLLTRLRNLRSLTVRGDFLINDPPDRYELAWIQTPSSPAAIRTSSTSKWLPQFLQGSTAKDAPSLLEESYLHGIDIAQSLEDNDDIKSWCRMRQQQWDNQFCSEYMDQAFPMVDGLVDMEFSGSYLDIEACLQAQLFRLQRLKRLQARNSNGPQDEHSISELREAAMAAEVWPQLKKICLVYDYPNRIQQHHRLFRRELTSPWHLEEIGSHILQDLRPDIKVLRKE